MSLELFAKHIREQVETFNHDHKEKPVTEEKEEIVIPTKPFILLDDIYKDVIPSVNSDKFASVSLIGSQGKGKTFSANILATLAEQDGFLVIYGKAEDFMQDKDSWIEQVKNKLKEHNDIRICFVLDDMSYSTSMVSAKKAAGFKHFVADVRHVLEPVLGDVKVFMIYISHRLHSLPPMLRNSGTWIFGSALPEDRADAIKLIPKMKEERDRLEEIFQFLKKVSNEGPKVDVIHYTLGDVKFTFKWGKEEDPGDGRLMMVSHGGEMKILQSKKIENMLDLEAHRIIVQPKLEDVLEEESPKEDEDDIRKRALQLFPVTEEKVKDPFDELKRNLLPITSKSLEL